MQFTPSASRGVTGNALPEDGPRVYCGFGRNRRILGAVAFVTFTALNGHAGPPPPIPCAEAIILTTQVAFTYQGSLSGCTPQRAVCIAGEQITFSPMTANPCIMMDVWQFADEPPVFAASTAHTFTSPGTFNVSMFAVGPNNTIVISKTLAIEPASSIPTLGPSTGSILIVALAFLGVISLSR